MKTFDSGEGEGKGGREEEKASIPEFFHSSILSIKGRARAARRAALLAVLALGLATAAGGCGFYSFTGATVPQRLDTVAIPLVEDVSQNPFPDLDNEMTQLLQDRFVQQTRLRLETTESEADALLGARIERYENEPTAVSGDERATLNRVTITVRARYVDQTETAADTTGAPGSPELLDRTSFSSFAEYDPLQGGTDAEREAAQAALENIADDIFTAATSDW